MDIGSINAGFVNAVSDNAKAASNNLIDKARMLKESSDASKPAGVSDAKVGGSDKELMDVCKEFEAYFIEQVFKNMKKSMVPQSQSQSGADATLKDFYEDKLMSEYAAGAAKQSENGLAQMLYEQMKRNRGTVDPGQI
ncbi:MAG: rod-binding protein [Lachnospiraceae bacterium]|nr:rod-binding protein [Lachnospiraceae bacterium]